ncbi:MULTISPECIES: DUF927 domain-containing protein [Paraburkholderia]|uniref:DUF927 domain-containing protein n=1 Tax=Paraburkholderia TaxID=1822464 RepID=UPI00037BB369|nr:MULTISPECIES: DUF927 domain-containing protein [Paraburkholderia]MDH6150512.1 putative DNA primase/helicase [Paraburkholderia sp. WSM4179]
MLNGHLSDGERIKAALACIPADVGRDDWVRIGTAIKSELGEAGFDVFDSWSQAGESYAAADVLSTWRSVKAGAVNGGTIIHFARQHGFADDGPRYVPDHAEAERIKAKRAADNAQVEAKRTRETSKAAARARAIWSAASTATNDHPYLRRKGLAAVDSLREIDAEALPALIGYAPQSSGKPLSGRVLVVPVKVGSDLSTVEFIDGEGLKTALKGGAKAAGFWSVTRLPDTPKRIFICEGMATALSAHVCTDEPAVASLSAGNMRKVAEALRGRFPDAELVLLADVGNGEKQALDAAAAVGGACVKPDFGPDNPDDATDFDDLRKLRGEDAVREQIGRAHVASTVPVAADDDESDDDDEQDEPREHYAVRPEGVFFHGIANSTSAGRTVKAKPIWLCDRLELVGRGEDEQGHSSRILRWAARGSGGQRSCCLPLELIGEREGWAMLRRGGLAISSSRKALEKLADYLQREGADDLHIVIERTGWTRGAFVLPTGEIIGKQIANMYFNGKPGNQSAYVPCGTLDGWRDSVGAWARGNALPMVAIACALAGPILPIAGEKDGIGLHLFANTSSGKTTTGDIAASVWGCPQRTKTSWSGTSLGHALNAEAANHRLLYLDEIGAGDASRIGPALYMMLNGQSKAQGARDGGTVAARSWLSTFLSSGEVAMGRYLSEGGLTPRGGQEIRMLDVPADGGAHRAFDCLHGFTAAGEFAEAMSTAAREQYGTLGRSFVEWLAPRWDEAREVIGHERDRMAAMVPEGSAPPVRRATRKFAILSAAAVMASEAGLTGWTADEARTAIDIVWKRWLDAFGTKDRDNERLIEQANAVLLSNEYGRFILLSAEGEREEPSVRDVMGYRRYKDGRVTFYVHEHAFRNDVIAGFDLRHACKVLHEAGMLHRNEKRRSFKVNIGKFKGTSLGDAYRMHPLEGEAEPDDEDA